MNGEGHRGSWGEVRVSFDAWPQTQRLTSRRCERSSWATPAKRGRKKKGDDGGGPGLPEVE